MAALEPAALQPAIVGGVVMGLASALHCVGMCSGICGSALLMLDSKSQRQRIGYLLTLQAGRITTYALLGAIGAVIGSAIISPDIATRFRTLQWAAALAMMATGLAVAGMLPRLALVDRGVALLSHTAERMIAPLRHYPLLAPYTLGMMWGANACPMVYGAVFTATLTGSLPHGVIFMIAFGIGTLPAVLASGFGVSMIKMLASRPNVQMFAGLAIAVIGFASIYLPWPGGMPFCITR